ncbi:hypothetical protein O2N63_00985 [Aliiroseovarius sp. KMU-50]|uniref:DUF4148 domain-containing protein n=1 Tax=Aliiroseovarius salicola TaxID=3009082 RepID=A0ABT4VWN0_9RHOB|nr:hypothetical protein [Aliiroseovarius sp. KMU-50]MDA5092663.1 hypothetical protein [Aliiroseovarius sp. KMU-50]
MIRTIAITAIAIAVTSAAPGFAGGNNPTNAKAMAGALKSGVNQDQSTKDFLEGAGFESKNPKAAVPSMVSGGSNGGWGNIGSTLTSPDGGSVSGR